MTTPRLGASLTGLTPVLTPDAIEAVRDSAIATMELIPRVLEGVAPDTRAAFCAMLDETGKRVASFHLPFGGVYDVSAPEEEARRRAVAANVAFFPEAAAWGATWLVLHASFEPIADGERAARFAAARCSIAEMETEAEAAGLRLAVETLPRSCLGNTVAETLALVEGRGPAVGICLDVNHMMDRHARLPQDVRDCGERLMTLHLSDYDGVDEKHWLPGEGVIDWKALMAALREADYRGPFNYEIARKEGAAPVEAARAHEESFARIVPFFA